METDTILALTYLGMIIVGVIAFLYYLILP
jgi:preprotein translocase subunit Sss1